MADGTGDKPSQQQVKVATTKVVRLTRDEVAAEFSNESGSDSEVESLTITTHDLIPSDQTMPVNVGPVTAPVHNTKIRQKIDSRLPTKPEVLRNIPVHYKILPRSVIEVEVCSAVS